MDTEFKIVIIFLLVFFVVVETIYLTVKQNRIRFSEHKAECDKLTDFILDASRYNLSDMMTAYDMMQEVDKSVFNKDSEATAKYTHDLFEGKFKYIVDLLTVK